MATEKALEKPAKKRSAFAKAWRSDYRYFLLFAGIALLGFGLFYLYPIVRTLILSFTDRTLFNDNPSFVGWANYVRALTEDKLFALSIKQSLIFAVISGILVLASSLIMALLLNEKVRFQGAFRTIFFLPFIIPSFAVGAVYKNLLNPTTGLVNSILSGLGLENLPLWYISPDSALATMIIISSFGFGAKMLVFLAGLQGIPKDYYEVAAIEGAGRVRQFFSITLPMISPMMFFNVILVTIDGLRSFSLAYVMGNGNGWPSNSTLLFPIYMFMTAFNMPFQLGYAAAMAWLFFLLILALTGLQFLLSRFYVSKDLS